MPRHHDFGRHHRYSTRARRAARSGDLSAAERWLRIAERELRIVGAWETLQHTWMMNTLIRCDGQIEKLETQIQEAEEKLAAAERRLQIADQRR